MVMLSIRKTAVRWIFSSNSRRLSSSPLQITPKKLVFKEYGNPADVLELVDDDSKNLSSKLGDDSILLKVLASPINPSDMNFIQGVYPVKPTSWPAISGNEGVMEVLQTGAAVTHLSPGDRVIPATAGLGLWRTHMRLSSDHVIKIDGKLSVQAAATIIVNPCTAYRMLNDFAELKSGDWVAQNAGTSAVGLFVSQLARNRGIRTLSIIRSRKSEEETERVKSRLRDFGADLVLTEEEVRKRRDVKAKLGLNCVGGKSVLSFYPILDHGSTMVTYGAMSMAPIPVPAGPLIFKDISLRGFWMTAWNQKPENSEKRRQMLSDISQDFISGKLQLPPTREVPFHAFMSAVKANELGKQTPIADLPSKQILVMS